MYQKAFRIFKQNPWQQAFLYGNLGSRIGSIALGAGALSLMERISEDMKNAMRAKDKAKTGVLRMLLSEFKYAMTSEQRSSTLEDDQALKVITAYCKKLKKSLDAYPEGEKRAEIAQEISVVESYMGDSVSS
ncbi:MAG TPA: GatB/YqeY domain-containing protein [Oligoflexus sp.]|uniref:GatB/YqeY domain-containing protein n=1 Tax=Oligoflexus sp. TaxID=1971216 RepID=UPI002D2626FA|nr:GatB/YqeY domain-containing protein [Oligoflexus sp.]HYX35971.1 GatB/YqeY domain-containing protein [Oligoflexus sp.]